MSETPQLLYPAAVGSGPIVSAAYEQWSSVAKQAFATAQQLAAQIADIPISPVNFNASFSPELALAPFPTIAAPDVPTDLTITMPKDPGLPPVITVPVLPPLDYVSTLLDTMRDTVLTLLGGNPLPASVAQALRDRANSAADVEENRAVAQAYDEFASRGFEEPPGLLNRRVAEARADARNKRQQVNRDIYIQEQTVAIENLRFAVTSGIQLEGLTVEVYKTKSQVELQTVQVAVEQNRLLLDGWRSQVELYDTRLKGEVARIDALMRKFEAAVEVYKANAQMATAAGEYDNRRFQLNLAQEQAIVDTEMKRADQTFQQMQYLTSVMLEIKKTLATVAAQLASSAMSAVNIGASLSSQTQEGVDYSLRVSYSGSMDDNTA